MSYVLLVLGLLGLVFGANYFVDGAAGIAKRMRIPALIIGLTIVAFGTSAPEVAVSVSAALKGSSGIAVGNVLGSNIFNIAFVLGIAAVVFPLTVERQTIRKEIPIMILSSLALLFLGEDIAFAGATNLTITRGDGLMLLLLFVAFMYYIMEVARNSRESVELLDTLVKDSVLVLAVKTLVGLVLIIVGGNLVVESAVVIAKAFGLSETLIGLTIVAIGTSLPELVTSVVASLKKNPEIAVGNVVGSNIFNVFFILGLSSVINPMEVDSGLVLDMVLNVVLSVMLLMFSVTHRTISKKEGLLLVLTYVVYTGYLVMSHI